MRATTVASWSGMLVRSMRRPAVVGSPAVLKMSLAVKGTPWRGPSALARLLWRSAVRAPLSALSAGGEKARVGRGGAGGIWLRGGLASPPPGNLFFPAATGHPPAPAP